MKAGLRNQTSRDLIGQAVAQLCAGQREGVDQLVEAFYPELRRMAAARIRRERSDHTLQPTALVNELYLELLKLRSLNGAASEAREQIFFGLAGRMMMRLLIQHARPLHRRVKKVPLAMEHQAPSTATEELTEIEHLLSKLAAIDPQLRALVEMKIFEGCSMDEIAARLGCAVRTVERRWNFARHWLEKELAGCCPE